MLNALLRITPYHYRNIKKKTLIDLEVCYRAKLEDAKYPMSILTIMTRFQRGKTLKRKLT